MAKISNKEMGEIFKNWNTPFGKHVRKLEKHIADNMVYEENEFGGKESPIYTQVYYYIDGIVSPLRFWHNIVAILGEMDFLHADTFNENITYNSDDKKFIRLMKETQKMAFNNH